MRLRVDGLVTGTCILYILKAHISHLLDGWPARRITELAFEGLRVVSILLLAYKTLQPDDIAVTI